MCTWCSETSGAASAAESSAAGVHWRAGELSEPRQVGLQQPAGCFRAVKSKLYIFRRVYSLRNDAEYYQK